MANTKCISCENGKVEYQGDYKNSSDKKLYAIRVQIKKQFKIFYNNIAGLRSNLPKHTNSVETN